MIFYLLRIKIRFHIYGFTLCFVLKQRLGGTREWRIDLLISTSQAITVSVYFAYTTQKDTHTKINARALVLGPCRQNSQFCLFCFTALSEILFCIWPDHRVLDCRSGPGCSNVGQRSPPDKSLSIGLILGKPITHLLDNDLSGGQRYPPFEQRRPVLFRSEVVIHVLVFADEVNEVQGERSFLVGKSWSL